MSSILQALQVVERDISRRLVRSTVVSVIDYKPSSNVPSSQLAPPGTIAVYVASKGSPLLKELRDAARRPKGGNDRKLLRKLVNDLQCRKRRSPEDVARAAVCSPVIADLNFAGKTLCKHLFVDGDSFGATLLPYTGAQLSASAFRFDEYYRDGDEDEGLECVLIQHAPELTAAEAAALKKVPPEEAHVFVAPGDLVANTLLWFLAAAFIEGVIVYGTFNISSSSMAEHLEEGAISSLGAAGSARAMLALRKVLLRAQFGASLDVPGLGAGAAGQAPM